jgi:hypothetical protein
MPTPSHWTFRSDEGIVDPMPMHTAPWRIKVQFSLDEKLFFSIISSG